MEKVNGIAQPNGEKLFNFRPLLFIAVFMAMGVVFSFFHIFQDFSGVWLIALLPLAALSAILLRKMLPSQARNAAARQR